MYERFNVSDTDLCEGMKVKGTVKNIKPYGAFIELSDRNKWTSTYRRYVSFKNKVSL